MKIRTIIVTHNGEKWITPCLESLFKNKSDNQVLVIDNASTDSTVELVRRFSQVDVLRLEQNIGFGRANNLGITRALEENADYIFLLNQDTRLAPNALNELAKAAEKNRDYAILAPLQFSYDGKSIHRHMPAEQLVRNGLLAEAIQGEIKSVYAVSSLPAAFWFVSRELFLKVGGFDPLFFFRGEDNDLLHRALYFNYKIGIVPAAIGMHDEVAEPVSFNFWYHENLKDYMLCLKDPRRSLGHLVIRAFCQMLANQTELLLVYHKWSRAAACWCAFFALFTRLKAVHNSRKKSYGEHALEPIFL